MRDLLSVEQLLDAVGSKLLQDIQQPVVNADSVAGHNQVNCCVLSSIIIVIIIIIIIITHTYGSRVSIAIISLCDSVCPHNKTKTAETKINKLGMRIVHHESSPINYY